MRPGDNGEVIFESTFEARVASQLLIDNDLSPLAKRITPPLDKPSIGRLEFLKAISDKNKAYEDGIEYTFGNPLIAKLAFMMLAQVSRPTALDQSPLTRKQFLGQRLEEFAMKTLEKEQNKRTTVEVGGMSIANVSAEEATFLKVREKVVTDYCKEKGWDPSDPTKLTFEQIMEIRNLPAWKDPLGENQS